MKDKTSKQRKSLLANIASVLLISILITFIFGGLKGGWYTFFLNIIYGAAIGLSIALGSGYISKKMLRKGDWLQNPSRRFFKTLAAITGFILFDVLIINMVWFHVTQDRGYFEIFEHFVYNWIMATEFIIGMVIYLFILSSRFVKQINEFYLEIEKNKEEAAKNKLTMLRNQINPHFLFNSLNVLSSLIYKDVEKADEFIAKLSDIYRYVVEVQDEEVVPLKKELNFVSEYLQLLKIRFGTKIDYDISIEEKMLIAPMSLQILVENAVKHNKISEDKPLRIRITGGKDHTVVVSNTYNPVNEKTASTGLGLDNLRSRYKMLTDKEIVDYIKDDEFVVELPLLNFEMP